MTMTLLKDYPGSKGGNGVWQRIIAQMPPHDLYVECFAGSAQVLFRKRPSSSAIAIDSDTAVCEALRGSIAARSDLTGVNVVCDAAVHWLSRNRHRFNRRTVIYCDPPYLDLVRSQPGRAYYGNEMDLPTQHAALLDELKKVKDAAVLVSGYRSELYDRMLADWRRVDYTAATHGGPVTESLWCNFPEPTELHDVRVAGDNFRERERIKRKARSWVKMLARMQPAERAAVIAAIDAWRHDQASSP